MKTGFLATGLLALFFPMSFIAGNAAVRNESTADEWQWLDAAAFPIHGQGWSDTRSPFDRFPARAEAIVRPEVWALSRDSAGIYLQFTTGAPAIKARWSLSRDRLDMWHMAATGVSGLDLYVKDGQRWRWAGVGRAVSVPQNVSELVSDLTEKEREFRVYLPLYNGVTSLEIGIPKGFELKAVAPSEARPPIVVYGTSITQGACASRPGMAYPSILGRRLDWPVINLGFSGNGRSEPEVAELLAELNPSIYVLDSLPNVAAHEVRPKVEAFVRILRESGLRTPIVLVENITYADGHLNESRRERAEGSNEGLRQAFAALSEDGYRDLHYVETAELLGEDGEDTVDGTHPTDLGLSRIADGLEPVLRKILEMR